MPLERNKDRISLFLRFALIASLAAIASCATPNRQEETRRDQIMNHCGFMMMIAKSYVKNKDAGMTEKQALNKGIRDVAAKYHVKVTPKLTEIATIDAFFIGLLQPRHANTMGYFVLTNCVAAHGRHEHRFLPLSTKAGRAQINHVLKSCEEASRNDDSLGACVLQRLTPLAKPNLNE
jgi:hypothetical protein